MQMIAKAAVFGLGMLASGAALAADSFTGSPAYYGQYAYQTSPSYYGSSYYGPSYYGPSYYGPSYSGTYPPSYSTYSGYPYYYGSYYSGYGRYPAPAYAWDPTAPWHPYSHSNPNWVPHAGWR